MTIDCTESLPTSFDSGPVNISSTSAWQQVATLALPGKQDGIIIRIEVGAGGALAGLKLTRAVMAGRSHLDWMGAGTQDIGAYVAWPDVARVLVSPTSSPVGTLPANGAAEVHLIHMKGVAEIGVWAKVASTATTVEIYGTVTN